MYHVTWIVMEPCMTSENPYDSLQKCIPLEWPSFCHLRAATTWGGYSFPQAPTGRDMWVPKKSMYTIIDVLSMLYVVPCCAYIVFISFQDEQTVCGRRWKDRPECSCRVGHATIPQFLLKYLKLLHYGISSLVYVWTGLYTSFLFTYI